MKGDLRIFHFFEGAKDVFHFRRKLFEMRTYVVRGAESCPEEGNSCVRFPVFVMKNVCNRILSVLKMSLLYHTARRFWEGIYAATVTAPQVVWQ